MKRPRVVAFCLGLLTVLSLGVVGWHLRSGPVAPHVQIVLASDGSLVVAGVPGRSMRARIQDGRFWDGQSPTSQRLVDWLRGARWSDENHHTYDGRAVVIVDDHASFLIAKMLIASAKTAYPSVVEVNGTVKMLPRAQGADKYRPPGDYLKDCSAVPPPDGCTAPPKAGPERPVH